MSEQTDVEKNPQTETTPTPSPPPLAVKESERNRSIHSVIGLCSLGIMGCFFLPWIRFLFADVSGYQLQQLPNSEVKLLWAIPLLALIALVASITNQSVSKVSEVAGVMPFLALAYYYMKLGQGIFDALRPGAYLTLLLGGVLIIAPRFLEKPKP